MSGPRAYVPRNPGLPPRALFTRPAEKDAAPELEGLHLFSRARMGIRYALPALGIAPGDTILAPAYVTGSALAPFDWAGVTCAFYDVDPATLAPDWGSAAQALARTKARALLLVHYFGFPRDPGLAYAFSQAHHLALIENCAHFLPAAPGGSGPGTFADAAIFSLRKLLPIPDGGALRLGDHVAAPPHLPPRSAPPSVLLPLLARHLAQRANIQRPRRGAGAPIPAVDARPVEPEVGILRWSRWVMARLDLAAARHARQENYRVLAQMVAGIPGVELLYPDVPACACPQVLPVRVPDAERTAASLVAMGVGAYRWPTLPPRCAAASEGARRLAEHILALPVHQGLSPAHLQYVADCVGRALGKA